MLKKNRTSIFSFLIFMVLASQSLLAFHIKDFEGKLTKNSYKKISIINHRTKLDFLPNPEWILNLDLESASKSFTKESFSESRLRSYDIDNFYDQMADDDFITIAKTAFLFPNLKPQFFSLDRVMSEEYCKVAFGDDKRSKLDDFTVLSEKNIFIKKIKVRVNFAEYNMVSKAGKNMTEKEAKKIISLAPLGLNMLEMINTTYSSADDISFGSVGSRTVNYYYNVGNKHSLQISIKVVTLKKEKIYDGFFARSLNVWEKIKKDSLESQRTGTRDSLQRIKKHFSR